MRSLPSVSKGCTVLPLSLLPGHSHVGVFSSYWSSPYRSPSVKLHQWTKFIGNTTLPLYGQAL